MKWSWRLGRIAGIDLYMHATFLILLIWVGVSHYMEHQRLADAVSGILFILTLFGIVVLHELGHALTARRFSIPTRDITLLPIGGVARLERMPDDPRQELLVALAGPAVNVVLAIVLLAALAPGGLGGYGEAFQADGSFLEKMFWVNISLAVFNLLPAFPMDGGRVLRALLAMRVNYVKATQTAAYIGQGMALLFGLVGLLTNPFLIFIALFVWMGASQESSQVEIKSALGGIPVRQAMITEFHVLTPSDPASKAIEFILSGFQQDFPVVEEGRVIGVLTRANLFTALAEDGRDIRVGEIMQKDFKTADPAEMLEKVFLRLQNCDCHTLPVIQNDVLVGMITTENIGEYMMIESSLKQATPKPPPNTLMQ